MGLCAFFRLGEFTILFFSSLDVLLLLPVRLILMDPIEIGSKSKYYYRITITPNYGDSSSIHVIELTFDLKNKRRVIYIRCAVHFKKPKDAFTTKSKEENTHTHTHCSKRNTLKLIVILCFIESQFNSSQAIN